MATYTMPKELDMLDETPEPKLKLHDDHSPEEVDGQELRFLADEPTEVVAYESRSGQVRILVAEVSDGTWRAGYSYYSSRNADGQKMPAIDGEVYIGEQAAMIGGAMIVHSRLENMKGHATFLNGLEHFVESFDDGHKSEDDPAAVADEVAAVDPADDPRTNMVGDYVEGVEEIEIPVHELDETTIHIKLVRGLDGKWRSGYAYTTPSADISSLPNVEIEGHTNKRLAAIEALVCLQQDFQGNASITQSLQRFGELVDQWPDEDAADAANETAATDAPEAVAVEAPAAVAESASEDVTAIEQPNPGRLSPADAKHLLARQAEQEHLKNLVRQACFTLGEAILVRMGAEADLKTAKAEELKTAKAEEKTASEFLKALSTRAPDYHPLFDSLGDDCEAEVNGTVVINDAAGVPLASIPAGGETETDDATDDSPAAVAVEPESAELSESATDGDDSEAVDSDDDAWRSVPLADLPELTENILDSLYGADIDKVGQLSDYISSGKKLTGITGIGKVKATKIEDILESFLANRKQQ